MVQGKQCKTEVAQLKMANKLLRTRPKKLQPFFWESDPYFTDFIEEGIDEKFKSVALDATWLSNVPRDLKTRLEGMAEAGTLNSDTQKELVYISARLARHEVRDLKKLVDLLNVHLQQIEMTREWK